jgi:hypothetical protein
MVVAGVVTMIVATYACGHWLAGLAVGVLLAGWRLLRTPDAPPVLALAFTFQWVQVALGVFYMGLTGAALPAVDTDWETMVLIGLVWISALALGLRLGLSWAARIWSVPPDAPRAAFSRRLLLVGYIVAVISIGTIQELAWEYPTLTQAILALSFAHFALFFLIVRSFAQPVFEWRWIAALVALEVLLGFTGYFAGWREPLILAGIATLEVFDIRSAKHWVAISTGAIMIFVGSLLWMGIRGEYRKEFQDDVFATSRSVRLERLQTLSGDWFRQEAGGIGANLFALVDRMWAIHYPALAVARVPNVLPHTEGEILKGAILHLITPRVLFPDKPELPSDSDMVRKYSGVWVAGAEENTSIAFGYAAESYVDFGIPLMFIPVFVFGALMGVAYQWFFTTIRHRDLALGLVAVIFWLGLYLFERSWVKTLGLNVTMMVYLGGLTFLIDRWLLMRPAHQVAGGPADEPFMIHDS